MMVQYRIVPQRFSGGRPLAAEVDQVRVELVWGPRTSWSDSGFADESITGKQWTPGYDHSSQLPPEGFSKIWSWHSDLKTIYGHLVKVQLPSDPKIGFWFDLWSLEVDTGVAPLRLRGLQKVWGSVHATGPGYPLGPVATTSRIAILDGRDVAPYMATLDETIRNSWDTSMDTPNVVDKQPEEKSRRWSLAHHCEFHHGGMWILDVRHWSSKEHAGSMWLLMDWHTIIC